MTTNRTRHDTRPWHSDVPSNRRLAPPRAVVAGRSGAAVAAAGGSGATPRRGRGQADLRHHLRDGSSAVTPSRQKHFAAAASRVEARRTPEATGALRAVVAGGSWSRCLSVSLTTVCLSLFTHISLSIRESVCLPSITSYPLIALSTPVCLPVLPFSLIS